jgi:3'-phosphoadenosine 5'-phosphosulfate sulfotransferase (PAPS reductase)/FAD synthetase
LHGPLLAFGLACCMPLLAADDIAPAEAEMLLFLAEFADAEGEVPEEKWVRFRTLGCYPLTGAVESTAATLPEIIQEMLLTRTSERSGRAIDHDQAGSMEKKKREGYF